MANEKSFGRSWRRSSFSGYSGDCVEVAFEREAVIVRDSQNPCGPRVVFSSGRWQAFLNALVDDGGEGGGRG